MFYPLKALCESRTQQGPFDSLFILLCLRNGFDTFRQPFWNVESVLSPEGTQRKQNPKGSIWQSFQWCLRNGFDTFKIPIIRRPFWNVENVLSPKVTLQSRAQWGPFDILSISLCLEKGVWCFKIRWGTWPFWNLDYVLFQGRHFVFLRKIYLT